MNAADAPTETPFRVLVVEDNPIDERAIRKSLMTLAVDVAVTVVENGDQAIGCLHSQPHPNLILLDLNLPGRDGFDVLDHLQTSGDFAHVPVLVLTTSSNETDVRRAYDSGANAYVTKPVDLDGWKDLMTRIQNFWFSVVVLPST